MMMMMTTTMMMMVMTMMMMMMMMIIVTNLHVPGCRYYVKVQGLDNNVNAAKIDYSQSTSSY